MSARTSCPPIPDLERLLSGKASSEESKSIRSHFDECTACAKRFDELASNDSLVASARGELSEPRDSTYPHEPTAVDHTRIKKLRGEEESEVSSDAPVLLRSRENDESTGSFDFTKTIRSYPFLDAPERKGELGWLANYRILEVLGEGGMGVVFRAEDNRLQRTVALKVKKSEEDGAGGIQRFLREARTLAALQHDHVVRVYEVGQANEVAYLAMEFLRGKSLADSMEDKRVKPRQVLRLAKEITLGLSAAHDVGVIHRDIKPDNIWLEAPKGRVKILDFGLARPTGVEQGERLTREGQIVGTPSFMSPEQARDEEIDPRSDLFSLGILLYQLASGEPPFDGPTSMDTLIAITTVDPEPLHSRTPSVPLALSNLVMKLLSKDRAGRPASAHEVLEEIEEIERALSVQTQTKGTSVRPTTPTGGNRTGQPTGKAQSLEADQTRVLPRTSNEVPPESEPPKIESPKKEPPTSSEPPKKRRRKRRSAKDKRRRDLYILAGVFLALFLIGGIVWKVASGFLDSSDKNPSTTASESNETPRTAPPPTKGEKAVKVFLLAGQSNMAGRAEIRTLDWIGESPLHRDLLEKIKNPDGSWKVRDDVWVYYPRSQRQIKKGSLTVGYGEDEGLVGPELMLGQVLGDHFDEQVLLIKVTSGPMSLAVQGRPPSSGGETGEFYTEMVSTVSLVTRNLKTLFPEYEHQGYELAGLVWFQGWNDMLQSERAIDYETNVVNLIKDLRKDLDAPNLPAVIGELGVENDGHNSQNMELIRQAQSAAASRPEFKGTVAFVPTTQYWDHEAHGLLKKGYKNRRWIDPKLQAEFEKRASHEAFLYLGSGKTLSLIGKALGEQIAELYDQGH